MNKYINKYINILDIDYCNKCRLYTGSKNFYVLQKDDNNIWTNI